MVLTNITARAGPATSSATIIAALVAFAVRQAHVSAGPVFARQSVLAGAATATATVAPAHLILATRRAAGAVHTEVVVDGAGNVDAIAATAGTSVVTTILARTIRDAGVGALAGQALHAFVALTADATATIVAAVLARTCRNTTGAVIAAERIVHSAFQRVALPAVAAATIVATLLAIAGGYAPQICCNIVRQQVHRRGHIITLVVATTTARRERDCECQNEKTPSSNISLHYLTLLTPGSRVLIAVCPGRYMFHSWQQFSHMHRKPASESLGREAIALYARSA